MRILVLVKIIDGELNPFDASALEYALQTGGEVTVLSMCPPSAERTLLPLTRLGTSRVILLSDPLYAGSDTLATARILSAAVKKIIPDVIFCGRQSIDGDTAQVGPGLAALCGYPVVTGVMQAQLSETNATCTARSGNYTVTLPAVLTFEKVFPLRFPSIRSRLGTVEHWSNEQVNVPVEWCGLKGSPTRVLKTYENAQGRRRCRMIGYEELAEVIRKAQKASISAEQFTKAEHPLRKIVAIGDAVVKHAEALGEEIVCLPEGEPTVLLEQIRSQAPDAVLWNADAWGRTVAPQVSVLLGTGLCADCTALETDGETLWMYRPARGGNIMAKIKCITRPQMATVRTSSAAAGLMVSAGRGIMSEVDTLRQRVQEIGGQFGASRGLVDGSAAPYEEQVGLTGKTVAPQVYIAIGISGAVHHTCAIENAGTIIAINPDRSARIFDYADYGIAAPYDADALWQALKNSTSE